MTTHFAMHPDRITRNYMRYCYDCTDAGACATEAKCLACWDGQEKAADEQKQEPLNLVRHYLRLQYD